MKIRTVVELQDAIDAEMGWRKRELTAIKANIQGARNFAKNTAMRSGIALLYAHWEGSVKNIATYYLEYVANLKLPYRQLKINFLAISLKEDLKLFATTGKTTIQVALVKNIFSKYEQTSRIPQTGTIKTNSNLNSNIFIEIMTTLGLDCTQYESSYNLIDSILLNMRNKIAHGELLDSISLDEPRYNEIHEKVVNLIILFSNQVANAAITKDYLSL